jgi:hypothetical protein
MADIFISYASSDRERARQLADALASRGYKVWWDRTIPPGRVFDEVIQEALHEAQCVIVLWSAQSVRSNWVKTEAAEGASLGRLVPALVERVLPPIEFKRIQAADLNDWTGDEDHAEFRKLLASVDDLLRRPHGAFTQAPPISVTEQTHLPPRSSSRGVWLLLGIAILAAIAAGGYVLGKRGSTSAPVAEPGPLGSAGPSAAPDPAQPAPPAAPAVAPATPAQTHQKPGRINLLAIENGGEIVTASHERWVNTIDGKDDTYAWTDTGNAVFGFKDGRAATFDTFAVLIPSTNDNNLGELELLASNGEPNGDFISIGTFKTQNIRIMKQPFQEFRFAPVTAKFLKVRSLRASNGTSGSAFAYEFRLMGTLE